MALTAWKVVKKVKNISAICESISQTSASFVYKLPLSLYKLLLTTKWTVAIHHIIRVIVAFNRKIAHMGTQNTWERPNPARIVSDANNYIFSSCKWSRDRVPQLRCFAKTQQIGVIRAECTQENERGAMGVACHTRFSTPGPHPHPPPPPIALTSR